MDHCCSRFALPVQEALHANFAHKWDLCELVSTAVVGSHYFEYNHVTNRDVD